MGKPKKGKKGRIDIEQSDNEDTLESVKNNADDEDDQEINQLSKGKKKIKKDNKRLLNEENNFSNDADINVSSHEIKNNPISNFAILLQEADDDEIISNKSESDTEIQTKTTQQPKIKQQNSIDNELSKKTKKIKKKTKVIAQEDDDLEAALAELGIITAEPDEVVKFREEEKARKKKEKKERQKSKKETILEIDDYPTNTQNRANVKTDIVDIVKVDNEIEIPKEDPKKKREKKKIKKEEEPKKKVPSATIKALVEAQEKKKQEEERIKNLMLEKEKRLQEALRQKEKEEQLLKEKKEKKKAREKAKKERRKKEGRVPMKDRARTLMNLCPDQSEIPNNIISHDTLENQLQQKPKRPIYNKLKKKRTTLLPKQTDIVESVISNEINDELESIPVNVDFSTEGNEVVPDSWEANEKSDWEESSESDQDKVNDNDFNTAYKAKNEIIKKNEKYESDEEISSDEETTSDDDSSIDEDNDFLKHLTPVERGKSRIERRHTMFEEDKNIDNLRAPVICVLGHVDTGKTKILDKLRRTNVQVGEAGGITQQIGATNVPKYVIIERTKMCKAFSKKELKLPGLLIIDTPGHESFSNLRNRGSSLCDLAILVVDIMHGVEPQTIESIKLLKLRETPFVIALNKVDRLYDWKANPNSDILNTLAKMPSNTQIEFQDRCKHCFLQLAEQGLNVALFNENKDWEEYAPVVPTSAHTGDGMGNLLATICEISISRLANRLSFSNELTASVMEVKEQHGLGTTIDVILVNGELQEGNTIICAGSEGPIVTTIRGLLMPEPLKELRIKSSYQRHKIVTAAQGVKIIAKDLDKALAGLPLYSSKNVDEIEYYKSELEKSLKEVLDSIKLTERGVYVQASTLGSLEALLSYLKSQKIPYSAINIGPIHKRDVMKASTMLEHDSKWAVILAFDVKIERDAEELAEATGVKIFSADIIYHLFDSFSKYRLNLERKKREQLKDIAVFPCRLRILPQCVFNKRDPIIVGIQIEEGFIKVGTPLCVPTKEFCFIGRIISIESNHKEFEIARKGEEVCIKIASVPGETPKLYGRHFDFEDSLVSKISRESIDAVKECFRDDMQKSDWQLMVELKKTFNII